MEYTVKNETVTIEVALDRRATEYGEFYAAEISASSPAAGGTWLMKPAFARHHLRALAYALRAFADLLVTEAQKDPESEITTWKRRGSVTTPS